MTPITGPFTRTRNRNIDRAGSLRDVTVIYKQAKPYDRPLAWRRDISRTSVATISGQWGASFGGLANVNNGGSPYPCGLGPNMLNSTYPTKVTQALDSARNAFLGKISEEAAIAVNVAERKQSMDMITNRSMQLFRAAKALKRFDIVSFAKELSIDPRHPKLRKQRPVSGMKQFSNTWLEYHFGWSPLVNDVFTATEILDAPIPNGKIKAFGRKIVIKDSITVTNRYSTETRRITGYIRSMIGAEVKITNPNLFLAARLGLTNPATIAWELVPFSFLVDWFVNVGDYLAQFSDLHGVRIINPYYTSYCSVESYAYGRFFASPYGKRLVLQDGRFIERKLGFPSITLGLRPPWRLSPSRALTAISLLVQNGWSR